MSSAEFTNWKAYADLEPFGFEMDNYRMGVPAAFISNTINGTVNWKRKPKRWKGADLYPGKKFATAPDLTAEQRAHIDSKKKARKKSPTKGKK